MGACLEMAPAEFRLTRTFFIWIIGGLEKARAGLILTKSGVPRLCRGDNTYFSTSFGC
jgi:hypothetical protein